LRDCGSQVFVRQCCAGHTRTFAECCQVPMCPRYQRKRSGHWVARARALMESPAYAGKVPKLLTVTLRHPEGETLPEAVEKAIKLRAAVMRHLRKVYGLTAAFGALEMSEHGHVHLHIIAWCAFLPRPLLQSWLRGRDCTVPGCAHPADDRCDECRAGKVECSHLDGGRQRCNGSFMLDVRKCFDPIEALKYAAAPVVVENVSQLVFTESQLEAGERMVRFYLAIQGRHRVETYGDAKNVVENEDAEDEDRRVDVCHCGQPLRLIATGYVQPGAHGYRWERACGPPDG
jgi:hypothetical protein